jgi:hypothetical protein
MAEIQPITIPTQGTANNLMLRVLPFDMDAKSCSFYYELQDTSKTIKPLLSGNIDMDEADFSAWAEDNNFCLEWAATKLGVVLL